MSSTNPRPTRPARPGMPPGMVALEEAHRQILRTLDDLARMLTLLSTPVGAPQAALVAAAACTFFSHTARAHHEAEETTVFPALLPGASAELLGHVRRLQQDHMWMEEDWQELEPHLQAVAQGYVDPHAAFLRAALPEFAAICREHIALEESLIYPEARRRQSGAAR